EVSSSTVTSTVAPDGALEVVVGPPPDPLVVVVVLVLVDVACEPVAERSLKCVVSPGPRDAKVYCALQHTGLSLRRSCAVRGESSALRSGSSRFLPSALKRILARPECLDCRRVTCPAPADSRPLAAHV